jgi:hypothetical protein
LFYKVSKLLVRPLLIAWYRKQYPPDPLKRKRPVCQVFYLLNGIDDCTKDDILYYSFRNKTFGEAFQKQNASILVQSTPPSGFRVHMDNGTISECK